MESNPQQEFISFISEKHGEENWISVYKRISKDDGSEDGAFYCALVSQEKTPRAMSEPSWDLMLGDGGPGFATSYENGEPTTRYFSNSNDGFRYLVLYREFHGRKENYFEISEEFRLFHNLYVDNKSLTHYAFDEAGDEVEVIRASKGEVKVKRGYLKSFMAATQTNLLLYFELTKHQKSDTDFKNNISSDSLVAVQYSGDSYSKGYVSFTRALGKKLLRCDPVEACGIWPYTKPKRHEEFIIGGDEISPKMFGCNPDYLANYFGANPDAPHYLTPIFFRKEVMQKYYGFSEYEVSDGYLSRKGAWTLRLDNNSQGHISVFLGDLGTDLPFKEQTYWKSFNVIPDGKRISRTNFQRSFMGNFYDPENPEHKFKHSFQDLQNGWSEAYGWPLFLPLTEKDEHFFGAIRSMLTNEQSEFDALVLAICKVTIDSANIKKIRDVLQASADDVKSIQLLHSLFDDMGLDRAEEFSSFLRAVQSVRSTGVAHRKGSEYEKVMRKLNIDSEDYQSAFDQILQYFVIIFSEVRSALPSK